MATAGRFVSLPKGSCFLLGPRGTGKTTWLREALPEALYVNLLRPETHRDLSARPERLRELVLGAPDARDVVIDEVQRAPELLPVIHDLIESRHRRRFILTGSSARKLRRGNADLLGGRAAMRTMHPFMAAEWSGFRLDRALQQGTLPLVTMADDPEETLASYASLYVDQEVQAEGLTRNVGDFARFLEAASFSHGGVLNVSNVARDAQVGRKTVEGYLQILDDLLLAWRIPVFATRAKRVTAVHPKFYIFDAGVFRSLRPSDVTGRGGDAHGAALEGLVAQHLRAWLAYSGSRATLAYWRTRAGVEVDFVVHGHDTFVAIEVKHTRDVRRDDVRGLRAFVSDYPACTPMLLYRGAERLRVDGVRCEPVDAFLTSLRPDRAIVSGR